MSPANSPTGQDTGEGKVHHLDLGGTSPYGRARLASAAGSGSGGGGGMDVTAKEWVAAHIERERARTDHEFTRVLSRLDRMPSTWVLVGAAGSVFIGIVAVLAFGGDRFDGGVQMATTSLEQLQETRAVSRENAEQIKVLTASMSKTNEKLDTLITKFEQEESQ